MRRLEAKIFIGKIEDNIFKFSFGRYIRDKEKIFKNGPWIVNGAFLILKEWNANEAFQDISLNFSTFILQIHGLPPLFLHEGTTEKKSDWNGLRGND